MLNFLENMRPHYSIGTAIVNYEHVVDVILDLLSGKMRPRNDR